MDDQRVNREGGSGVNDKLIKIVLPTNNQLTVVKDVSQIVAYIAVPIILAVIGYWANYNLQSRQADQKYVEMAIGIMGNEKADKKLKDWAFKIVSAKSPIPLPDGSGAQLEEAIKGMDRLQRALVEGREEWVTELAKRIEKKNKEGSK